MAEDFDLDTHFKTEGLFFTPSSDRAEIPGRLLYSADGIALERSAYIIGSDQLFPRDIERFDSLLGVTAEGNCTLFDVFLTQPGPRTFLEGGQLLTTAKYHVGSCVIGVHIPSRTERVITSASFRYAGLENRLGSGISQEFDAVNSRILVSHPLKSDTFISRTIAGLDATFSISYGYRSKHTRTELTVAGWPVFTVTPDQPQSLTWFLGIANRLENFLSLVLGVSTALTSMGVKLDEQVGKFLEKRLSKAETLNSEQWIQCTPDQLCDALEQWFSLPDRLRPIENLIYGTIRNSSLFVETEFLSLAQAAESFHRVTDDSLIMPTGEFKEVKRVLWGLIEFFFKYEQGIQTRLKDSISHVNEPTFRNRIESLIERLTPENANELLGNKDEFIDRLRDTRNFFTHPGIKKKATVLLEPLDLFKFNQQLHAFLRLLVLMHVGFPEQVVFSRVANQIPKFVKA